MQCGRQISRDPSGAGRIRALPRLTRPYRGAAARNAECLSSAGTRFVLCFCVVSGSSRRDRARCARSRPTAAGTRTSRRRARLSCPACSAPLVVDEHRCAGRLGQELGLAGALHRDEPPRRLVDRMPDSEEPVVAVDGGLVRAERRRQRLGCGLLEHDGPTALRAHGVVLVEDAGVLCDRIERASERRPGLAVDGVGMGGGDDVGRVPRARRSGWRTPPGSPGGSPRRPRRCG